MHNEVEFVPTSIGKVMTARLRTTHKRRGISIFAGPPGIGKTTAVEAFCSEHPGEVAIIKTERTGATGIGARMVMSSAVMSMRGLIAERETYVYRDTYQVRRQLGELLERWAWAKYQYRPGHDDPEAAPRMTFVFDEAQTLSRAAIEALRYWNDRDRTYGPFPIGLAFVGNSEFALQAGKGSQSVISAAVADRALYTEEFDYDDVSNGDLKMILAAHGVTDEMAVAALVKHYSVSRVPRSLRRLVERNVADLKTVAGNKAISLDTVRTVLAA